MISYFEKCNITVESFSEMLLLLLEIRIRVLLSEKLELNSLPPRFYLKKRLL